MSLDLAGLSPSQLEWVQSVVNQFRHRFEYWRNPQSEWFTEAVTSRLGDALRIHHSFSRQALSKDRFEFALERALNLGQIPTALVSSRTNRGHDLTIAGVPVSLKSEAAGGIKQDTIHVSKWMELGRGEWDLPLLLNLFLEHMKSYERIFTLRYITQGPVRHVYELVEIPKPLMLEAEGCRLQVQTNSKQNPQPGYGFVEDEMGGLKYSLYFDGGSERKLQIKSLRKDLCIVHARWDFDSSDPLGDAP